MVWYGIVCLVLAKVSLVCSRFDFAKQEGDPRGYMVTMTDGWSWEMMRLEVWICICICTGSIEYLHMSRSELLVEKASRQHTDEIDDGLIVHL